VVSGPPLRLKMAVLPPAGVEVRKALNVTTPALLSDGLPEGGFTPNTARSSTRFV
jgi:hypothetical protein